MRQHMAIVLWLDPHRGQGRLVIFDTNNKQPGMDIMSEYSNDELMASFDELASKVDISEYQQSRLFELLNEAKELMTDLGKAND